MAKIIKLIYTEERVGNGTKENPTRMMPQLWSMDGDLIAEYDPSQDPNKEKQFFKGLKNKS